MDFENENVKNIYSKISNHFSNTRYYKWYWVEDFLNKFKSGCSILDIGCGNGRNMERENINIIGIDNCLEFINICKKKNQNVILADMCDLPFKNYTFNGIMLIASFHHLSTRQRRNQCLKEIKRVLMNGGKCLISVWSKNQPKKTKRVFDNFGDNYVEWKSNNKIYNRYYYIFKLEEIKKLISLCGLEIVKSEFNCGNEIFTLIKV